MDVKNINYSDSQNFGMAFIRPKDSNVIKHFYRVRNLKMPNDEYIERGLRQLEKEHVNDVHFDFMYNEGAFPQYFGMDTVVINPKSSIAKNMVQPKVYSASMLADNFVDSAIQEIKDLKIDEIKSPFKRFAKYIKARFMMRRLIKQVDANPKLLLPDNLRLADEYVTLQEKNLLK